MLQIKVGEVRLLRVFGRFSFSFILLFFALALHAGAFTKFQVKTIGLLQNIHNKQDKKFQMTLYTPWHEYNALITKLPTPPPPNKILLNKLVASVGPRTLITLKPLKHIELQSYNLYQGNLAFNFFGYFATFDVPKQIFNIDFYPQDKQGIINFFNVIAHISTKKIIKRIKKISKTLRLNDWGIFTLTNKLSNKIFKDKNNANLLTWYLLNKLHFDVKVALSNQRVKLLIYCKNTIFNTLYFLINYKKYYLLFNQNNRFDYHVVTYLKIYPKATKALNLDLKHLPLLPKNIQKEVLNFTYLQHEYFIHVSLNKNLTDFLQSYPITDQTVYFNAPMQLASYHELASQLIGYINGKRASRAINFVLAFIQHAFKYKMDNKNLPMFAQQALAHKILGNKARAMLFAYLIKNIFSIHVIGVQYKNYLTTALQIPMQGYSFMVDKNRYVVADPSYINANIGQIPSKYIGIKPQKFIHN